MAGNAVDDKQARRTGYECEFVESPPKPFQSECSICLHILREPYIVDCCGYSFCAECIECVAKYEKPCPLCNQPDFTTMVNKGLKRTLNGFRVYCPHRLRGCAWVGELGKLDEHLNSDQPPQRHLEGCPFAVIECVHCKEGIRRDEIADHQLEHCPQRPHTCKYCIEYKSTFEDVVHSHWPECKCFLLPCPNECTPSGSVIQRQHLDQHVRVKCPLTVVQCKLHHAGCEVTRPRKDVADHMKEDSISHISLLAAENYRLCKDLLEKEEQIVLLTQKNSELEEKTNNQLQGLTQTQQELTHGTQVLLKKVTSQSLELTKLEAELKEAHRQAIDRLQIQQQRDLQQLRSDVQVHHIVPVTITMDGFDERKKNDTIWYSRPFYTAMGGYKMCLSVHANGHGADKGTHVAVYICLMRGKFDSHLRWPFRGTVTIQLVNQWKDKKHVTVTCSFADTYYGTQVTDGERYVHGWGISNVILHSQLAQSVANKCHYLKDNCLIFRVTSIKSS